jgi:formylmethanofuran dehydrogenase subunit E
LLHGFYDESANAQAFAEARQEFLSAQQELEESEAAVSSWNVSTSQNPKRRASARPASAQVPKESCYQCYKLFFKSAAHTDNGKAYCSAACVRMYHLQNSATCAGCSAPFPRQDASVKSDGKLYCPACAAKKDEEPVQPPVQQRYKPLPSGRGPPKVELPSDDDSDDVVN